MESTACRDFHQTSVPARAHSRRATLDHHRRGPCFRRERAEMARERASPEILIDRWREPHRRGDPVSELGTPVQIGLDVCQHHARQNRRSLEPIRRHLKLLAPIFKLHRVADIHPTAVCWPPICQFTILSEGFGQSGRFWNLDPHDNGDYVTCRRLNRLSRADAAHFFRARACHHAGALSPAPISERRANHPGEHQEGIPPLFSSSAGAQFGESAGVAYPRSRHTPTVT